MNYRVIEQTISLCPYCLKRVNAKIILKNKSIYLLKHCPIHGEQTELLEEDSGYFLRRIEYDKPGTDSERQTEVVYGCPFDCGLCPDHNQHTCIGLIEITNACDLKCPVCFSNSGQKSFLSLETIDRMLDFFVHSEYGRAEILQISGGEPTSHPFIIDIIRLARKKNIKHVLLNTNGLRIADDNEFVKKLSQFVGSFEIYLQFDGFNPETSRYFFGEDLIENKQRAVDVLTAHGIPVTLVSKVERGINDSEVGAIVSYAVNKDYVRGVNFQPVAYFGRQKYRKGTGNRITLSGIIKEISKQTSGMIQTDDFIPLPCDAHRVAINYMYRDNGDFMPLTRGLDVKQCLPHIRNTFKFDPEDFITDLTDNIFLGGACCGYSNLIEKLRKAIPSGYFQKAEREKVDHISEKTFRLTVTSFVDAYNFEINALKKECVHVITQDLKRIPFSAYNMLYRGKQ